MTLAELSSASAVRDFLQSHPAVVVTFSAHWCGPCNRSKPQLMDLAVKYAQESPCRVRMGIVYESDLGEEIHSFNIRAFPTYVLYLQGVEKERVQGANLPAVQAMMEQHCKTVMPLTGGATLGGGAAALSPEQARLARLEKLQAAMGPAMQAAQNATQNDSTTATTATTCMDVDAKADTKPEAKPKDDSKDVDMKDADDNDDKGEEEKEEEMKDPTEDLDQEALETLMNEMGFPKLRAQKGLLYGNGSTVESAVEWLMEHQDDADIDEPIALVPAKGGEVAQSYKCNECGKVLSNMANLELHANKTGHSDFEESTESVKPLSPEEKAAKIAEIKELLKLKRAEREEAEKVDQTEREKQRRFMGKEMAKTREQLEMDQRKREAMLRKREKEAFKRERARIREELAKDKAERQANKGKLNSKLGVDGYNPDAIQYDVPGADNHDDNNNDDDKAMKPAAPKKPKADASRIDEYIAKVSSYKAGGDGGKCLKILTAYVTNAYEKSHTDDKFRHINLENKVFKTKVKPFMGAKNLLMAVGFQPNDDGTALELEADFDKNLMAETKAKLEAAMAAY